MDSEAKNLELGKLYRFEVRWGRGRKDVGWWSVVRFVKNPLWKWRGEKGKEKRHMCIFKTLVADDGWGVVPYQSSHERILRIWEHCLEDYQVREVAREDLPLYLHTEKIYPELTRMLKEGYAGN